MELHETFLNLVAIGGFVALVWLARNRRRLGGAAADRFGWKLHPAWIVVGGLFGLTVVGSIPIIGWIVSFFAVLFGVGALAIAATTRPPAGQAVARAAA